MIPRAGISSTGVLKNVAYASLVAPTSAQAGFRLDANGAIVSVASTSAVVPLSRQGALTFDANGALVTVDSGSKTAPISYSAGIPLDANGYAVTTTGAIFSVQDGLGYDVNGNLCALVSSGGAPGALSVADNTSSIGNEDMTAAGYLDYYAFDQSGGNYDFRKSGANLLVGPSFVTVNSAPAAISTTGQTYSASDGVLVVGGTAGPGSTTVASRYDQTGTNSKITFTAPAGSGTKKVKVTLRTFIGSGTPDSLLIRGTLSDASASPVTFAPVIGNGGSSPFTPLNSECIFTYNSNGGGTLIIDVERTTNGAQTPQVFMSRITYGT